MAAKKLVVRIRAAVKPTAKAAKALARLASKSFGAAVKGGAKVSKRAAAKLAAELKSRSRVAKKRKPPRLLPAEVMKQLELWRRLSVTVGIHSAEGAVEEPGGLSVAEIMTIHEFGATIQATETRPEIKIPKRSWLRDWFDEETPALQSLLRQLSEQVAGGLLRAEQAAKKFGSLAVGAIQKRWARNPGWAPNSDLVVARKKSSKPLIDTGQARASVSFEVRIKQGASE